MKASVECSIVFKNFTASSISKYFDFLQFKVKVVNLTPSTRVTIIQCWKCWTFDTVKEILKNVWKRKRNFYKSRLCQITQKIEKSIRIIKNFQLSRIYVITIFFQNFEFFFQTFLFFAIGRF